MPIARVYSAACGAAAFLIAAALAVPAFAPSAADLCRQAERLRDAGKEAASLETARRAVTVAVAARDLPGEAIARALVVLVGQEDLSAAETERHVARVAVLAAASPADSPVRAWDAWVRGERAFAAERWVDGIRATEDALDRFRRLGDERTPRYVYQLANLAVLLEMDGQVERAAQLYARASAAWNTLPDKPYAGYATTLANLAGFLEKRQDPGAPSAWEAALRAAAASYGDGSGWAASCRERLSPLVEKAGDKARALALLETALATRRALAGPRAVITGWDAYQAGRLHAALGRPAEALARFDEALHALAGTKYESFTLHNLRGIALFDLKRWPEAAAAFARAVALADADRRTLPAVRAALLRNLGRAQVARGEWAEAAGTFEAAATAFAAAGGGGPEQALAVRGEIARALFGAKRYTLAAEAYGRLHAVYAAAGRGGSKEALHALTLHGGALALAPDQDKGRLAAGIAAMERALALARRLGPGFKEEESLVLNYLGSVLYRAGRFADGARRLEECLALLEATGKAATDTAVSAWRNLGACRSTLGDMDGAFAATGKALAILAERGLGATPGAAAILHNQASITLAAGEPERAITLVERALALYTQAGQEKSADAATCHATLGTAYLAQGNAGRAVDHFLRALAIRTAVLGPLHADTAHTLLTCGRLAGQLGQHDLAQRCFDQAAVAYTNTYAAGHPAYGELLSQYGVFLLERKSFAAGAGVLESALSNRLKAYGERHEATAFALHALAAARAGLGDTARADALNARALAAARAAAGPEALYGIAVAVGRGELARGLPARAAATLDVAIGAVERLRTRDTAGKAAALSRHIGAYYLAYQARVGAGDLDGAFRATELLRARGFLERLSLAAALGVPGIAAGARAAVLEASARLERAVAARANELARPAADQDPGQLLSTMRAIEAAELDLAAAEAPLLAVPRYRDLRRPAVLDLAAARAALPAGTACLAYVLDPDERVASCLVVTRGGAVAVPLDAAFDYAGTLAAWRAALVRAAWDPAAEDLADRHAAALYTRLVAPLEAHLAGSTRLAISPDGPLAFLPFDALRPAADKPFLGERFVITAAPSMSVLAALAARRHGPRPGALLAFGGATYGGRAADRRGSRGGKQANVLTARDLERAAGRGEYFRALGLGWEDLPGTRQEAEHIGKRAFGGKGVRLLLGADAREATVKALSRSGELARWRILHFACHGWLDQLVPSFSAVVLGETGDAVGAGTRPGAEDGYLTCDEVAQLDLSADLVTLSACETGLGKLTRGDGVTGLARSFLAAGADRVAVTLWSVDDDATRDLMVDAYTRHAGGLPFADALAAAKRAALKDQRRAAPWYWAGFTLYGW